MLTSSAVALVALALQEEPRVVARVPEGFEVVEDTLRFAPDGKQVAYVGSKGEGRHPVIGGEPGKAFERVDAPVIDSTGEHVAFRVAKEGRASGTSFSVLYDGRVIATDDWIGPVSLSPADGTPAYWMTHGWTTNADGSRDRGPGTLCVGKKKGSKWQSCDPVLAPVFSADGRFVFTVGTKDEGWAVLRFDHRKGKEEIHRDEHIVEVWPQPGGDEIVYTVLDSSSGNRGEDKVYECVVYRAAPWASRKDPSAIALGSAYDSAGSPVYSPDGARVAFLALHEEKFGVALEDEEIEPCTFDFIDELTFDPLGERLAYVASNDCELDESNGYQVLADVTDAVGGRWWVVFGDEKSEELDGAKLPSWSPDGTKLAFAARQGETWRVHAGETSSERFDEIACIRWENDGKSVWFGARRGAELWWSVLAIE